MKHTDAEIKIIVQKLKLKKLFMSKMVKPLVDTGLGFSVDGGRDNLQDFQGGLALNLLIVRDSTNVMRTVTEAEMAQIIQAIQANGATLYQRKWELESLIEADPDTDIMTGWPE